jgi:UDP-glucose 4-epimerase
MKKSVDLEKAYRGKKVLVTGGMGFIGSSLAHKLVALGADVTLFDCFLPDHGANDFNIKGIADSVRVVRGDIREEKAVAASVGGKDYIFSLAAQALHVDSMRNPPLDVAINCGGSLNVLEACRKLNPAVKIVFASTRQVYGKPDYLPVDEKHPLRPVDVNGVDKLAAEQYHALYYHIYGLRAVSLRLTNTYGPRQIVRHNRANFTGWLIRQALDREEISLFGDGSHLRDFTYIDDVVGAFLMCGAAGEADGGVFNLGGDKPYSLLDFVKLLLKLCPGGAYKCVPFPAERKNIDVGSVYSGYAKIKKTIGWAPVVGLEEGLARTIEFFKKNRAYYW